MYTYKVKSGDSAESIAKKFGHVGRGIDLINVNLNVPRKSVVYMGKRYIVFADLYIDQKLNIPGNWIKRGRIGVSGVGLGAGEGESCGYTDWCDDPYTCENGICKAPAKAEEYIGPYLEKQACKQSGGTWDGSICTYPQIPPPDTTEPTCNVDVMSCNQNSDCCSGYCNTGIKVAGAAGQCQTKGVIPPILGKCKEYGGVCAKDGDCCSSKCQNGSCCGQVTHNCANNSDCCSGNCQNDGTCTGTGTTPVIASVEILCTDPDVIIAVQDHLVGLYPALANVGEWGVWGPADTAALADSGETFINIWNKIGGDNMPCTGDEPVDVYCPVGQDFDLNQGLCVSTTTGTIKKLACAKGYKLNPQGSACIPTDGGDGLVKIKEEDEDKKEPKSEFPWGWVIAGVVVVAGGGAIAYYAMKDDKSKKIGAATTSSIPSKPLEAAPAMAGERRRFVRGMRY